MAAPYKMAVKLPVRAVMGRCLRTPRASAFLSLRPA